VLEPKTLLTDWVQSLPPKEYPHLSPSSLGQCHRAHYWKLKGIKDTTPPLPGALVNFQVGFLWEGVWDKALDWSGVEYKSQVPFMDEGHNIGGTCDFLVCTDPQTKQWEIWDSKTVGSAWFKYKLGEISRGTYDEFKEEFHYIIQQLAYIWMARRAGYNVTRARLAYVSKDDGFVGKVTDVYLTPENEKLLLERINYMNECLKNDDLPKCECEGWKIGYCGYGNPLTQTVSKTKKIVNTDCCPNATETLEAWRNA
jgi:CRISPR/Cas system-associated exonuclease Cas4 (RecB family)